MAVVELNWSVADVNRYRIIRLARLFKSRQNDDFMRFSMDRLLW
jgi:hypothetical protein